MNNQNVLSEQKIREIYALVHGFSGKSDDIEFAREIEKAVLEARAGEAPSFSAKHVSLKQRRDGKLHLTLELNEVEGAPHYTVSPVNPAVVRTHPPTGDAAGKDSVDAAKPQHWNPVYNTDPVQRACSELPLGWEIQACMEQGAGWVNLFKPNGDRVEFDADADCFDWKIHVAIDAAIASLTKTADGEKQS
jgi:hypothetical protein